MFVYRIWPFALGLPPKVVLDREAVLKLMRADTKKQISVTPIMLSSQPTLPRDI